MATLNADHVNGALDTARTMLSADGYDLDVALSDDGVRVAIVATPDACEECLVPRTVMEPMLAQMLSDGGVEAPLELHYPDAHHQA